MTVDVPLRDCAKATVPCVPAFQEKYPNVLDIRKKREYVRDDLPGTVNIPLDGLDDRWYQLCDRGVPFTLIGPCEAHLSLAFPVDDGARPLIDVLRHLCDRWCVATHVCPYGCSWDDWCQAWRIKCASACSLTLSSCIPVLYAPSPTLGRTWPRITRHLTQLSRKSIRVLDLGCGSGRDAIWTLLASKSQNTHVTCVDLWEKALGRVERLATDYSVDDRMCTARDDIDAQIKSFYNNESVGSSAWQGKRYDVILCARFYHPNLIFPPTHAGRSFLYDLLAEGGIAMVHTFCQDEEGAFPFPHPSPTSPVIADRGRLEEHFSTEPSRQKTNLWTTWTFQIDREPQLNRPMVTLVLERNKKP